jgi:hypothetical protein
MCKNAGIKDAVLVGVIRGISVVPGVKGKIEQENQKVVEKIEGMVKNKELDELASQRSLTFTRIPAQGLDSGALLAAMRDMRGDNIEKAYAAGKALTPHLPAIACERHSRDICLFVLVLTLVPDLACLLDRALEESTAT